MSYRFEELYSGSDGGDETGVIPSQTCIVEINFEKDFGNYRIYALQLGDGEIEPFIYNGNDSNIIINCAVCGSAICIYCRPYHSLYVWGTEASYSKIYDGLDVNGYILYVPKQGGYYAARIGEIDD